LALSELVATIRGAAGRGTSQVRRLLGFSRTPLLTRGTVDLSAVLKQLQLLLATSLREDIVLAVDEDPGSRWIDADAVQLEGALLNLVLNAQGAIVKTGRIRVSARPVVVDGDAMVRIEVSDNGQGMDEATRARIFEPFFTTKVQGRGSGLGLAMVKAFARQFGGSITLDSVLGQGSTFALTLPAAPDGATDFGELASVALAAPCCYSVLLVEDDDVVRITARAMLELLGHKVQECSNAELALQVLDANKRFQILFTDIMMPGRMSGIELAAAARQRCASLKVILTSGWAGTDLPEDFKIEPSETFVLKPYSLEDLSAAIAKAGGSDT
jgi:CheY-like chemotaxis protein/two-component sensor histidine kinase